MNWLWFLGGVVVGQLAALAAVCFGQAARRGETTMRKSSKPHVGGRMYWDGLYHDQLRKDREQWNPLTEKQNRK